MNHYDLDMPQVSPIKKRPIVRRVSEICMTHRSAFSTLPSGRLLCGQRGCPSRTPYGISIIARGVLHVNPVGDENLRDLFGRATSRGHTHQNRKKTWSCSTSGELCLLSCFTGSVPSCPAGYFVINWRKICKEGIGCRCGKSCCGTKNRPG